MHSQGECLNPPVLFSFGSAELHFRFERNPKGRRHCAAPGTFWQVLAQFPGLLGTADPLQTWAGLSILSTSQGWEVSWLTSFPNHVILCFSAVLPIYLESNVFSLFN